MEKSLYEKNEQLSLIWNKLDDALKAISELEKNHYKDEKINSDQLKELTERVLYDMEKYWND